MTARINSNECSHTFFHYLFKVVLSGFRDKSLSLKMYLFTLQGKKQESHEAHEAHVK